MIDNYERDEDVSVEFPIDFEFRGIVIYNEDEGLEFDNGDWGVCGDRRGYFKYEDCTVCSEDDVYDALANMLLKDADFEEGVQYEVSGVCHLIYDISGITQVVHNYTDSDGDGYSDIVEEYTEGAEVELNEDDSFIENLKVSAA